MLIVPYIEKERDSSLSLTKGSDANHKDFVDKHDSTKNKGIGDVSAQCTWRLAYSDENDVSLGLELNGDNAPTYFNESNKIALGSGATEITFFLKWFSYPRNIDMTTSVETGMIVTRNNSVTDDNGKNLTLKKSNSSYLDIGLSFNSGMVNYGGDLRMDSVGTTNIDGKNQGDGYLAYSCKLFLNLGNMYLLEQNPLKLPWMAGIYIERVISGVNAPDEHILGLKASFYF